ncbi:MAG: ATP-grasp domain-containing protein [Candidatus Omnitrophica bacterium]|nr:ATP-grasp domain-containing protein [Candidatus Omnitrophota bacterium]
MGKVIGLTFDLKTDYQPKTSEPSDANAEFDHPQTINLIADTISSLGHQVKKIGNVFSLLDGLDNLGVDIIFNISEGLSGRNRESQIPVILEAKGIPFVGSDGLTLALSLDKLMAKKVFLAEGIPTPRFMQINQAESLIDTDHFRFPLMVKPRFEGSSKGIDSNARINDLDALIKRTDYVINTYKQPALIEEFIKGREFTVAIVGNDPIEVFSPVQVKIAGELNLGEKFYTFGHITSAELEYVFPAPISKALEDKLKELALCVYKAVDCLDFGRVDFRVDEEGNPFVLEINPLPCMAAEDVFMLIPKTLGMTYAQMLDKILQSAFKRYNL